MEYTLKVVPAYVELKKGEEKQIQVITDAPDYYVTSTVSDLVAFDKTTSEVEGLKAGTTNLVFKLFDDKGNQTAYDTIRVDVIDETITDTPVSIMLHNRHTNCLYTILGGSANIDIDIKLPRRSGVLYTSTTFEGYDNSLVKPTIVAPAYGTRDHKGKFLLSKIQYRIRHENETVKQSYWEFALDHDFKNVIRTVTNKDPEDMTTAAVNVTGLTCYVRARWETNQHVSDWSDTILVTFSSTVAHPEHPNYVAGDLKRVAYYGVLNKKNLRTNFLSYRGVYDDLIANEIKDFAIDDTVSIKDKLWRCLKAQSGTVADMAAVKDTDNGPFPLKKPGMDINYWVEENSQALPDFKVFARQMMINIDYTDSNEDRYSANGIKCGEWITNIDEASWVKVGFKGRILYVASHPVVNNISWNDLAKAYLVYGNRTLSINGSIYKVRLLKEEEYAELIRDGAKNLPELKNVFVQAPESEWIEDWEEGYYRSTVNKEFKLVKDSATNRSAVAYRPVLEYMQPGSEPHNNVLPCVNATDEKFQYDPFTDTGYFGIVPGDKLRQAEDVALDLKWTDGSFINKTINWYKFYWHGLIIYTPTAIIKNKYARTLGYANHFVHPHNLGHEGNPTVVKDNVIYQYGLMSMWSLYPAGDPETASADTIEWGRGSMITELFLRMYSPYSNVKKGSWAYWTGYQVGTAWSTQTIEEFFAKNYAFCAMEYGAYTGTYYNNFSGGGNKHALGGSDHTAALMLVVFDKDN